jgi:hypothetical protein
MSFKTDQVHLFVRLSSVALQHAFRNLSGANAKSRGGSCAAMQNLWGLVWSCGAVLHSHRTGICRVCVGLYALGGPT